MEINKRYGWISSRTKENKPSDQYQSFFVEIPESVVKESLQNSVDAAVNLQEEYKTLLEYTNEETVKAKIQVISLSKEAKVEWLKAVDYENSLKKYYELVKEDYKKTAITETENANLKTGFKEVDSSLKDLEDKNKPLVLINITDTNTTGLLGKDEPDSKTEDAALNRLMFSIAADGKAGKRAGSWQLGKLSYIFLSRMSMFLIHSNLSNPVEMEDKTEKSIGRIRGLVETRPSAIEGAKEDKKISGLITFGEHNLEQHFTEQQEANLEQKYPMKDRNTSIWDEKGKLSKQLYIDEIGVDETGTTIQIPQIKPIKGQEEIDIKNYAEEIGKQVKKYFWPAIISNKLEVTVEYGEITKTGGIKKNQNDLHSVEYLEKKELEVDDFIDLFSKIVNEKKENITIFSPDTENDSVFISPTDFEVQIDKRNSHYNSQTYKPKLVFRKYKEIISSKDEYTNKIALIRGAGIVVDYITVSPPDENLFIKGLFLGGTALEKEAINLEAEEWHRLSEDPAHRSWWGQVSNLKRFFTKAKEPVEIVTHAPRVRRYVLDKINTAVTSLFTKPEIKSGENDFDAQKSFPLKVDKDKPIKTKYTTSIEDVSKKIIKFGVSIKGKHELSLEVKKPNIVFKNSKTQKTGSKVGIKKITTKSNSNLVKIIKDDENWFVNLQNNNSTDKKREFYVHLDNKTLNNTSFSLKNVKLDFSIKETHKSLNGSLTKGEEE